MNKFDPQSTGCFVLLFMMYCWLAGRDKRQTFSRGNSTRSANWMRTLEFVIWERAQTSAWRRICSHLLTRSLWPDASILLRAAARPAAAHQTPIIAHDPLTKDDVFSGKFDSIG
jgi:hypothetical protein